MSRPRKTIEITKVVEIANRMLEASNDDAAEGRTAIALMLESILFEANAYAGFSYLGVEVGEDDVPVIPDETRRHYYVAQGAL